jgi:hypothetical protein
MSDYITDIIERYEEDLQKVKQYGWALIHVKEQTPELNGLALHYVKEQTPELCLAAVKENACALQYVKEQTYELCLAAGKQNVYALQFIKDLQIKEKIRLELNL